jgi:hypothetical protein
MLSPRSRQTVGDETSKQVCKAHAHNHAFMVPIPGFEATHGTMISSCMCKTYDECSGPARHKSVINRKGMIMELIELLCVLYCDQFAYTLYCSSAFI